jgi:tetratricopeptide (TPR) repeat protein
MIGYGAAQLYAGTRNMSFGTTLCLGKLCLSCASLLTSRFSEAPLEHVRDVFEALDSGGEILDKLGGPEAATLHKALVRSRAEIEKAYEAALQGNHSEGFRQTAEVSFANLGEVFESCVPGAEELARLRHDPEAIANRVADNAVARSMPLFESGEGRKILVSLVVLAYTSLDKNPKFMAALQRVNWKKAFDQLAEIRGKLEVLGPIKDDTTSIRTRLDELLGLARQGGAFQRAEEQGVSELAVRKIVLRLGGEGIGKHDLLPWLDNWIETAQSELGRRTNEDGAFEAARLEAERRFKAGLDNPSSALMEEFAREEQAEADRQVERKRRRIRILEQAIRVDELSLHADAAAVKLRLMAEVEARSGWQEIGRFLFWKAGEFFRRGDQRGENSALLVSIATYREALRDWTRQRVPLDWAAAQGSLGNALAVLGEWESGTGRLEQAVAAYRLALGEYTRERAPNDWAQTQNNLGAVLLRFGERESGTLRLEEAVAVFRMALEARTRARVPLGWAETQMNLGNALARLGEREAGTTQLEKAVSAYRAALEEYTRERTPLDWANTQSNLGFALRMLGERDGGTARLEEAVAAFHAALQERARERFPLQWAETQMNLGGAFIRLGEREQGTARLEQAVAAFREALQENTRDRVPLQWARTQMNLGNALAVLGEREGGTARLEWAVQAYRAALEEYDRERVPLDWAMTQSGLGNALRAIGELEGGTAKLEESVAAYRDALQEHTREGVPLQWAASFGNQGVAMMLIADRANDGALAETAVKQIEAAYETTRDGGQEAWAAMFQSQLIKAQAIRDRLKGK